MLLATFSCIHTRVALFYHWEKYCRVLEKWKHPWKFSLEKMSALKQAFASMKWPIDWLLILKPKKKLLTNTNFGQSVCLQMLETGGNFNADILFLSNTMYTLQKNKRFTYSQIYTQEKHFKICHILWIRKSKDAIPFFILCNFIYFFLIMNAQFLCHHRPGHSLGKQ